MNVIGFAVIYYGGTSRVAIVACATANPSGLAAVDGSSLSFSQNLILLKGKFGLFHNKVDLVLAPGMD